MGNSQSNTLHEAAANNDLEKAQKFIREEHRDVNEKDKVREPKCCLCLIILGRCAVDCRRALEPDTVVSCISKLLTLVVVDRMVGPQCTLQPMVVASMF